jgi:hypothetical protein
MEKPPSTGVWVIAAGRSGADMGAAGQLEKLALLAEGSPHAVPGEHARPLASRF